MNETINNLSQSLRSIREAINAGIDSRINRATDIDISSKLGDNSSLEEYKNAIQKLNVSITSTDQQLIILYTYAKDFTEAENKRVPSVSWKEDEIVYGEFNPIEWVPVGPIQQDPQEKLYIRFVTIIKDSESPNYGIPIQMTGDAGPQGQQGQPGQDAVILTAVHRLVKLYNTSSTLPVVPTTFKKDNSADSRFQNNLSENRIYYTNGGTQIYVNDGHSEWKLQYSSTNESVVWEIDVDINSKNDVVKVISDPVRKNITVTGTEVTYATSDDGHTPPRDGWDVRDNVTLNEDNPYLWSKTTTTYSDGFSQDTYLLINEIPTTITGIEIKYLGTTDFTKPSESDAWVDEMPVNSPVIWKKETTTYSNDIYSGENTKTTIVPIVKQGPAGVQFIGHVTSSNELSQLSYTDEFIGKIAMLVGADTYIWYGVDDPVLENCQQYNGQYWLNMGPIHVCDWGANEGELGYIKNKPEEKIVQLTLTTTPYQLEKYPYFIEWALSIGQDCGSSYFPIPDDVIIEYDNLNNTIRSKGPELPVWIYYKNPWKSNLISEDIFVEEITYLELIWKVRTSQLSVGKTYKLNCLTNFSGQLYNNGHVLIKAVSTSKLDNFGIFVHNDEKVADCWWDDFNKSFIGEYNDSMINPISVCKTNIDTYKFIVGGLSGSRYECHKNNVSIITFSPTRIVDILNNDYNPSSTTISGKNNYVRGCDSRIAIVIGDGNHISFADFGAGTVLIFGNNHFINASISGSVDLGSVDQPINNCVVFGTSPNCKITKSNTFKILDSSSVSIESGAITAKSGDFSDSVSAAGGFFKQ